ncbi:MAG: glycosyltransferase [Anaerolineae bacterium]|nr:glycosyltransferase [Anaerolineae bacterium]
MAKQIRVFSCVGGAGASAFWTAWLAELETAGFEVAEVSAVSNTTYRSAHGVWARLVLRFQMYVGMLFHLLRSGVFAPKGSVLIVTTNPFYAPWFLATFAGRRCCVINLVYDVYPDSLVAAGKLKPHSIVARLLSALTRATLARSHATVFLGAGIQRYFVETYGSAYKSCVIPVGADCTGFSHTPVAGVPVAGVPGAGVPGAGVPDARMGTQPMEILYCGNLGMLHETETLVRGLAGLEERERSQFHFRFCASGSGTRDLGGAVEAQGLSRWFTLGGPLDGEQWQATMAQAPIGLVLLKDAAAYSAVPSKVYSAMAAGQAILAICPSHSDLATVVRDHDCGWVIAPGDTAALAETLRCIAQNPASVDEKRANAYRAARRHFCMPVVAQQWIELIHSLS